MRRKVFNALSKASTKKYSPNSTASCTPDLRNCPLMDSTFMGTLTGVALRLHELGSGQLRIVNLNERNRDLLTNLGIDQLMELDAAAPAAPAQQQALPADALDKATRSETMLTGHENLVQANPANEAKFKDVLEYLRHDLHITR